MAGDIAVGVAMLAAAMKEDRLRREEEARRREQERQRRDLALRVKHVEERRGAALEKVLDEIADLDRLRRLVTGLRDELVSRGDARVVELLAFAEHRLASREAALSADGLAKRLEEQRLFGDDDDHDFRPPHYY